MNGEPLSQAALGRALGLSKAAITKHKLAGMPVDSVEAAQAWRAANLNIAHCKSEAGSQPTPPPPADGEDFQAARTRREIAEANLAEMREAELEGKLIRVDAIRAAWSSRMSAARDALLQIPHRLAPVLAAEADTARVSQLLDDELRQALYDLTRDGVES